MQLLRSFANPDSYALYTRWGRVGEHGRSSLDNTSATQGERMFSKKFKSKTGVEWAERETATPQPGSWTLAVIPPMSR